MPAKPLPQALPIQAALEGSAALARLVERLRDSQARLEAVKPKLPMPLRQAVAAGPVDDAGTWTLLADNAAVAAKLRQCVPLLEEALRERGWPSPSVRVKVRGPGG